MRLWAYSVVHMKNDHINSDAKWIRTKKKATSTPNGWSNFLVRSDIGTSLMNVVARCFYCETYAKVRACSLAYPLCWVWQWQCVVFSMCSGRGVVCLFSLFSIWIYCLFARYRCVTSSAVPVAITNTFRYWFFHAAIFITHIYFVTTTTTAIIYCGSVSNPLSNWRKPSGFFPCSRRKRQNKRNHLWFLAVSFVLVCVNVRKLCFVVVVVIRCSCRRFECTLHCYFGGIHYFDYCVVLACRNGMPTNFHCLFDLFHLCRFIGTFAQKSYKSYFFFESTFPLVSVKLKSFLWTCTNFKNVIFYRGFRRPPSWNEREQKKRNHQQQAIQL